MKYKFNKTEGINISEDNVNVKKNHNLKWASRNHRIWKEKARVIQEKETK